MTTTLKIDFVSDVSCPWCIIGLKALEQAADRLQGQVALDLHFQPFELNPQMAPEGQDIGEHLHEKYGATPEQSQKNREAIAARGAALGFTFSMDKRSRIYNTFDAHRLLHWAEEQGLQPALKKALFKAYFTDGQDPSNHEVLVRVASEVGLDAAEARALLASYHFAFNKLDKIFIHATPGVVDEGSDHWRQGNRCSACRATQASQLACPIPAHPMRFNSRHPGQFGR